MANGSMVSREVTWPTLPPGWRGSRPTNSNWTFGLTATVSWPDADSVLAWIGSIPPEASPCSPVDFRTLGHGVTSLSSTADPAELDAIVTKLESKRHVENASWNLRTTD